MTQLYTQASQPQPFSFMNPAAGRDRHPANQPGRVALLFMLCCLIGLAALSPTDGWAKTKRSRVPRPEPELKIIDLKITPIPFTPENGPLEFSVTVQLPKQFDGATVLEVSSLISSPSKTSLRFLSQRQELSPQPPENTGDRQNISLILTWDGQDQTKQRTPAGTYAYEVRTKLLTNGEKGLRTSVVAWPKRGTLEVK